MCGGIRGGPRVFVVIVTQLVTQLPHALRALLGDLLPALGIATPPTASRSRPRSTPPPSIYSPRFDYDLPVATVAGQNTGNPTPRKPGHLFPPVCPAITIR